MSNIAVTIKPTKTFVSSVTIAPQTSVSLGNLTNVDATDPDDGETLVFDATSNTFIVRAITVDSNNITNVNGGTF